MPGREGCCGPRHLVVYREEGFFGGWPANNGIWSWGGEVLVGFIRARHREGEGHTYDRATARKFFARSRDGGLTWSLEDGLENGITAAEHDHQAGLDPAAGATGHCPGAASFRDPGFALTFTRRNNADGPSFFYCSEDRGRRWHGPWLFPSLGTPGIAARTEYFVEGGRSMTVFLTTAGSNGLEGRVACAHTDDGARTWRFLSWIGLEPAEGGFLVMPAAVRLPGGKIMLMARRRERDGRGNALYGLDGWLSADNGLSWARLPTPGLGNLEGQGGDQVHNPPAMIRLADGRICLAYGVRRPEPARVCVRLSGDGGFSWGPEIIVRGGDGACWDMGYPRMVQRPDGAVLLVYYYNHALRGEPSRYIAATVFRP